MSIGLAVGLHLGRGGSVTPFVSDDFTGLTDGATLQTRSPWARHSGSTASVNAVGDTERIRSSGGSGDTALYYLNVAPPSADYDVRCNLVLLTDNGTASVGVTGRHASAALTFYLARYNTNVDQWQLIKSVAGAQSTLGTAAETFAAGVRALVLRMRGDRISLLVDGIELIVATDSAITSAGFAGVRFFGVNGTGTGIHIDTIAGTAA